MKLRPYSGKDGERGFTFYCPGCRHLHAIRTVAGSNAAGAPKWSFNGDMESPTFAPSLLCYYEEPVPNPGETEEQAWDRWERKEPVSLARHTTCHLFLTAGMLQFLGDCPHELAGKVVALMPRDSFDVSE